MPSIVKYIECVVIFFHYFSAVGRDYDEYDDDIMMMKAACNVMFSPHLFPYHHLTFPGKLYTKGRAIS